VVAAWSVTGLALHTGFFPGTDQPWQVILVAERAVARGMAATAVIGEIFLPGVVCYPTCILSDDPIGEVELVEVLAVTALSRRIGDDVAFLVNKAGFPVISTDHIGDIVPGVTFGKLFEFGERVIGRLSVDDWVKFPSMARFNENLVNIRMAAPTSLGANVFGGG
jgi:hypothetical protein